MHLPGSMVCGFFFSPCIAPCGHFSIQTPQPLHRLGSISNRIKLRQTPAGHLFSLIWVRYSSLKFDRVVSTGFGAVLPNWHSDAILTYRASSRRVSRSFSVAFPSVMSVTIPCICVNPSRHEVHLPQDSSFKKLRSPYRWKNRSQRPRNLSNMLLR